MSGAQLHLALNHLPIVITWVATLLLLWGWLGKSEDIKKAGLGLLVLCVAFAAAAYYTGEPAEHVLKSLPGFPRPQVHEHEAAAFYALIASLLTGLCALAATLLQRSHLALARKLFYLVFALSLWSSTVYVRVAHLGGLIKHEEVRSDPGNAN